ncbi:MAG: hypothetical protein JST13_06555 [Bacteroidetes bacterium]|nr:hypothetical protein [Bacteroidota bacterium]
MFEKKCDGHKLNDSGTGFLRLLQKDRRSLYEPFVRVPWSCISLPVGSQLHRACDTKLWVLAGKFLLEHRWLNITFALLRQGGRHCPIV